MTTRIRPELSKRNPFWLDRHRYYELKHFCLQYPLWKKELSILDGFGSKFRSIIGMRLLTDISDPTFEKAEARLYFSNRIAMVEQAAFDADPGLMEYILRAVVGGYGYESLRTKYDIPCSKDTYYDLYRRFFWLLSHSRK